MRTRLARLTRQYANHTHLETRRSIYRHRRPLLDLPHQVLSRLDGVTGTVVDVGAGPGAYTRRLRAERPELARVRRPDGVVVIATNAEADKAELPATSPPSSGSTSGVRWWCPTPAR